MFVLLRIGFATLYFVQKQYCLKHGFNLVQNCVYVLSNSQDNKVHARSTLQTCRSVHIYQTSSRLCRMATFKQTYKFLYCTNLNEQNQHTLERLPLDKIDQ